MGEPRLIVQAYRFELDPSAEEAVFLGACCGAARFWFNQALDEVKRRLDLRAAGEEVSVPWSYHQLGRSAVAGSTRSSVAPTREVSSRSDGR